MDANESEGNVVIILFLFGSRDPLVFEARIMPEVQEQAEMEASSVQIIQELGAMFVDERRGGFKFDNDFAVTNKVRLVGLQQSSTTIDQRQCRLRNGWYALMLELDLQTFLINRL